MYILLFLLTILTVYLAQKCWSYILVYRKVNKLPGPNPVPILGTISYVKPTFKESLRGFHELCEKHNGIYKLWLGPIPYVIIYDADYAKTLLTKTDIADKSTIVQYFMREMASSTLFVKSGREWRRNRKILYSSVTQQMVNSFMPIFNRNSRNAVQRLEKELDNPKPFDINKYMAEAAFDNICDTTMGVQLWSAEEKLEFFTAIQNIILAKTERLYKKIFGLNFLYSKTEEGQKERQYFNTVHNIVGKILDAKSKQMADDNLNENFKTKKESYLETIIRLKEDSKEFSNIEFRREIVTVLVTGYETTSMTLSIVLLHLATYKDVQERVYKEIYELFGDSDRPVELDDLEKLDYLDRTIKEVGRIFPTVLQVIRQTTKEIQLDKHIIPAGVQVYVSIYHLHNNKKYWKDPEKFDPDRFLPEEVEKQYPYSYIPFGMGPRMCPGMKYGTMFVKVMLINILRRYEVSTTMSLDLRDIDYTMDVSIRPTTGYLLSIADRRR